MQQKKCNNREFSTFFSLSIFSRIVFMKSEKLLLLLLLLLHLLPHQNSIILFSSSNCKFSSIWREASQSGLLKDWEIEHIFPSKMGYWSPSLCLPNFQSSSSSSTWVSASKIPTLEGSLASYSNGGETLVGELEEKIPFKRGVMHTHSSRELHALYLIF